LLIYIKATSAAKLLFKLRLQIADKRRKILKYLLNLAIQFEKAIGNPQRNALRQLR
jgi:hypothetical protein